MNVTIDEINSCFNNLLSKRGAHKMLCQSSSNLKQSRMRSLVNTTRGRVKKGRGVSIEFKINWLLKSGWRPGIETMYTKSEVIDLVEKAVKLNKQTRSMGGAFIIEHLNKK